MMGWIVVAVSVVILFIAIDTIKCLMTSKRKLPIQNEVVTRETERMVKLEAEVDEKMKEMNRHQSERLHRTVPAPAAPAAIPAGSDPMNDTRCMHAVKEKADEIERLAGEKGIRKV